MRTLKLMLGLMLLIVGAVATPVGAQAGAEGFLALQGVQAEALSDQELDAIKGQEVPTMAFVVPSPTACTTGCTGLPVIGSVSIAPAASVGETTVTINGTTTADTTTLSPLTINNVFGINQ